MDDRRTLAWGLRENTAQLVAANLLRYDVVRRLLEGGKTHEAVRLLQETVGIQRRILLELRELASRIDPPKVPLAGPEPPVT